MLIVVKCLGSSGDGGPASSARLYYADRTDVDSAGNVYIADTYNNVIRKVSGSTGIISTIAGSFAGGSSGDGGDATSAKLYMPYGVGVDSSGTVLLSQHLSYYNCIEDNNFASL